MVRLMIAGHRLIWNICMIGTEVQITDGKMVEVEFIVEVMVVMIVDMIVEVIVR